MGLTRSSSGRAALRRTFTGGESAAPLVALMGNPNTGKSTLFNLITGLNQHTGNWPGKTILLAQGQVRFRGKLLNVVDLPGTYSLLADSQEEKVARDFLIHTKPDATVVVCDATCLERNLNLVLQVAEFTPRVVLCVNLLDEAERKGINVDLAALSDQTGLPVAGTAARCGRGIEQLLDMICDVAGGVLVPQPRPIVYPDEVERFLAVIEPDLAAALGSACDRRWVGLRLLDEDDELMATIEALAQHTSPKGEKESSARRAV